MLYAMKIENIELTEEDKAFAKALAEFRKVPVEEILFCLRDPQERPDFLKKAGEDIEAILSLALEAHKTHRWVNAPYNKNRDFNTIEGQHKFTEKLDPKLVTELARATTRKKTDIEKFWDDDTMMFIIMDEALVNMKKEDVDPEWIDAVLSLLRKSPKFHRALQENTNLEESYKPFAKKYPLIDAD